MIKVISLNKSFGNQHVLKNINATFKKGEIVGIVGDNGAGKTTLFNCLAGLENFDGNIEYSGESLKNVMGFLTTNPYFISKITGNEYLRMFCNARKIEVKNLNDKNIFELPLNQYAETYSTGMKKKLALNAILLQENEVFILDEPFNGVDIHSNIIIKEILLKLKALNKIVILSSHIFSTLSESCDFIFHLKEGEIIKCAEKNEFSMIEDSLKQEVITNKIENLNLK